MNNAEVSLARKFIFVGTFLISKYKKHFCLLLFLGLFSAVLEVFTPQILGVLTNALQQGRVINDSFPFYWFRTPVSVTILFVSCGLVRILTIFAKGVSDRSFQNRLTMRLKSALHDKIISMDAAYHSIHDQGESLFNINNSVAVVGAVATLFVVPAGSMLALVMALINLCRDLSAAKIPVWLIFCIVPALFVQPFIGYWLGEKINQAFARLRTANVALNGELLNSLKSPLEVQIMNAQQQRSSSVRDALKLVVSASNRANTYSILDGQLVSICILLFQSVIAFVIVICYFGAGKAAAGIAGTLIACITLIPVIFSQIQTVVSTYIQAKQVEPEIASVYDILTARPAITDAPDAVDCAGGGDLTIRNVGFGYDEAKRILKGLSATLPRGKAVAIVSHSGGGKSTLLHLLSRLYDPQQGEITLAGKDIRKYKLASLRESVVRISQFPLFIQGTVRDNFRLQKPDATDAEIEEACKAVGMWDVLKEHAHGDPADMMLSLGAENLSGGQRRLLSIARAMLKHPAVIMLDEPTTGVDAQTTQEVIYPFLKNWKSKTLIVFVDHNMNFVRNLADMVLVIENGGVADFGATEEVWANERSLFRKLWEDYNKNPENAL